jgi:hypothetical protein
VVNLVSSNVEPAEGDAEDEGDGLDDWGMPPSAQRR